MFKSDIACADTRMKCIHSSQIQLSGVFPWEYKPAKRKWTPLTNYTTTNSTMNVTKVRERERKRRERRKKRRRNTLVKSKKDWAFSMRAFSHFGRYRLYSLKPWGWDWEGGARIHVELGILVKSLSLNGLLGHMFWVLISPIPLRRPRATVDSLHTAILIWRTL